MENGLPPYVSKHPDTKLLRYFRRPPTGVVGSVFSHSFKTKDKKVMLLAYGPVHDEAERYFDRLRTGRDLTDTELFAMVASPDTLKLLHDRSGRLNTPGDFRAFILKHGSDSAKALSEPDLARLGLILKGLYAATETAQIEIGRIDQANREERFTAQFGQPTPNSNAFTLSDAFTQAWKPEAKRSPGTVNETERFVNEFIALNGELDLKDYTRAHWAKWHGSCLELHGPGGTAFKRFSMVKTVVASAIRSGLFERRHHAGQDVTMRKPGRKNLRNEGWSDEELKELFGSEAFTHPDDAAAYWIPTIIALTGARLSEVAGMQVPDMGKRHGVLTFYLAREEGKTEESRRIIPVPQRLIDLGLNRYIETRKPKGSMFDVSAKVYTKRFGRYRTSIGVDRKGCDLHAFRHHMKTMLRNVGAPDVVSDYLMQNADPELEALMRPVLKDLFLQQLDELKLLAQPIETPYRVDPKDSRAGEKFLEQHKAMGNARAARKRDALESLKLLDAVRSLMLQPQARAEQDDADDAHSVEAEKAQQLLDAVRGRLNPAELKQLRTETGDAFNIPHPAGSDPDEDSDA